MKISVIIPIYNSIDCLEKCVKSVQAQTYNDLEIILVDDGSTDGSADLVDELASGDSLGRTVAIHKENGGSSSARNLGISVAKGDYLAFVDSDDYIERDMYETLARAVDEYHLDIVQTGRDEISADGTARDNVVDIPKTYIKCDYKDFIKELLLHKGDCSFCTKLVNRRLFSIATFPEGELNEDFWLLIQILTESETSIGILPRVGYHVYYREKSNTRNTDKNVFSRVFTDIVVNADRMEKLISDKYPELIHFVKRFALVQRLDYMLHIPIGMMKKDNTFYMGVKSYLRENKKEIRSNPYLSDDQRSKLKLLVHAPKMVREIHLLSMKLRGIA